MNYPKIILIGLLVAGAVTLYAFFSKGSFLAKQNNSENNSTPASSIISLLPQINGEGEVTVKVSPQDLSQSATTWDFEVLLDTHSQNLGDADLANNSVLLDDKGHQASPVYREELPAGKVEPPQEHHRQFILKFAPITPRPKSIELKIKNIGDIDKRSFKWELP